MRAGSKRTLLWFQSRDLEDDGFGTIIEIGEFKTRLTAAAEMRPLRGSEAVQASRLQGIQPYVVTIRSSDKARDITTAWRAVDARNTSRVFAITAPPADETAKNAYLDIVVQEGVAQ